MFRTLPCGYQLLVALLMFVIVVLKQRSKHNVPISLCGLGQLKNRSGQIVLLDVPHIELVAILSPLLSHRDNRVVIAQTKAMSKSNKLFMDIVGDGKLVIGNSEVAIF